MSEVTSVSDYTQWACGTNRATHGYMFCSHLTYTDYLLGPLNTVAADPQGKTYASGGEDGYVRVHHFDKGYYDFTYEVERQAKQRLGQ